MAANPFLLAADNPAALLPLLRENPALASAQDDHGYSLVHAAASYNHLDLLRALIQEFNVDVDLRDEDEETALFVVETIEAAKVLIEELAADLTAIGTEGRTAREKIAEEGDYPEVVEYLESKESSLPTDTLNGIRPAVPTGSGSAASSALPNGLRVSMGTMEPDDEDAEVDPVLRRRIEELAEREDFHTEAGQAELRRLVEDAIGGGDYADRNVRSRQN
ncbi:Ankyrin repeats (many copies) [Microdochium nivale]|nr:Ankyrin repeats (many copies) [Microdochium nivale]